MQLGSPFEGTGMESAIAGTYAGAMGSDAYNAVGATGFGNHSTQLPSSSGYGNNMSSADKILAAAQLAEKERLKREEELMQQMKQDQYNQQMYQYGLDKNKAAVEEYALKQSALKDYLNAMDRYNANKMTYNTNQNKRSRALALNQQMHTGFTGLSGSDYSAPTMPTKPDLNAIPKLMITKPKPPSFLEQSNMAKNQYDSRWKNS